MTPVDEEGTNWRIYLAVWGLAAAVRLGYLLAAPPVFTIYYWDAASSLLHDGSLAIEGVRTAALEPLYPLFLAAARLLVGDPPPVVQAVQALVASCGAVYLYKLAMALTGRRRIGLLAATLFAVYPLLVHHSIDGTESALLTTLLIAFAYQFVTMRTIAGAAAAGGWLGLAVLTRTVALPLLLVAPLVAAAKSIRLAIAIAAVAVLLLTPFMLRNYALNGAIVPARTGINLFIANCEYAAGVIAEYGPDILVPYGESRLAAEGLADLPVTPATERQWDTAFRRLAFAEISQRPLAILWLKIRNVFTFFSPILVPHRYTSAATTIHLGERGESRVEGGSLRPLGQRVVYSLSYGSVVVLAGFGLFARRRNLASDTILWCVVLTFAAVHAVFFPSTRYRAPVDFVFLFYAAIGVDRLIRAHPWRVAISRLPIDVGNLPKRPEPGARSANDAGEVQEGEEHWRGLTIGP
jgi:hypothetical protein